MITSPAYGNGKEALFPYKLKIPISQKDKQRAEQSQQLWGFSIKPQLIARSEKLESQFRRSNTKESNSDRDWITNELEKRIEAAKRLLPLPEESTDSAAVAAQPETQKLMEELNRAGKEIAISRKRKAESVQRS